MLAKGEIVKPSTPLKNGYYVASISLYDSGVDLKYSFGRTTVFYRIENGKHVYYDFYDTYDFDSKPWFGKGSRSIVNEIITRGYNLFSNGTPFEIHYQKR